MRNILYILCLSLVLLSCERRELTYDYDPTIEVILNVDWSDMQKKPTGMSVYCYPESGEAPTVTIANINSMQSSIKVKLGVGVYNILVFNQIPTDFGTISFDGMERYETAEINTVTTKSNWAKSRAESELVRDPEEVAAATYLGFEITEEEVRAQLEEDAINKTKADVELQKTIDVAPKVVIKTSRVKIRVSGIHNYRSARATLFGMASGYNFSQQKSHTSKATHILESWTRTVYEGEYTEGEITTYHTSFGLPDQTTETRATDYSDWNGVMDVDFLLVDNKTIVSESYDLKDRITIAEEQEGGRADGDVDVNKDADIYIDLDYKAGDTPVILPDVKPEGGASGGFDASIDDWEHEESHNVPI